MVARAGLPLQDMEFVQFHPSGIYGAGVRLPSPSKPRYPPTPNDILLTPSAHRSS